MESTSYYKYIWTNVFVGDENKAVFLLIVASRTIPCGKLFLYDGIDVSRFDHAVAASPWALAVSVFRLAP
ncbi:hypothetical protein GJA_2294 [Janthinobacterium agaricidamnosum NBRC 102515 = DSM 9628]|uniref:Uncharacterized protein n=1 Tax=Janthinobacterium agaricidamnosum NBRC 102515 = DSM 9628 TaxID=1349767 RepID=W0V6G1_9BURK|nr:hypothetical protein GJA_2294 [Janthinobacterium agaricidamnosum NBRC 102515 = DSM 9628]